MKQRICDPNTEVIGQVMLSYIDNLQTDLMRPILEKHHLTNIEPDTWYPLQPWLNFIQELSTLPGFSSNMIAVGLKVAEYAVKPPEMANVTLEQILEGWNDHLYANHRSGNIGSITTEKVAEKHYRTIHRHIYPDDLSYGLAYAFARTILPPGTDFKVWYENYDKRLDNGNGDETVICVKWE